VLNWELCGKKLWSPNRVTFPECASGTPAETRSVNVALCVCVCMCVCVCVVEAGRCGGPGDGSACCSMQQREQTELLSQILITLGRTLLREKFEVNCEQHAVQHGL
jgi:hypothetical protein